ncbi:MAG TPA: PDZ domain-containing protein [Ignavibacteriaceae bacterium]|nr:PDZ domain-containing protein [Ignavibacteriaceae bacterium]
MRKLFLPLLLMLFSIYTFAGNETRLLRFPAIHGNQIVFTYAGNLYTVSAEGGIARRITNDVGYEMFARFSPDGKSIAFTGQYDGNTEVYLMPAEGGVPKRLTYTATLGRDDISDRMGPNNIVMGWRDDNEIVYRSRGREWNSFKGQLFLVSKNGGLSQEIPLSRAGFCSFSSDGKKMAYNQVFREFRTWKRYRGGQADDIWIFDFATKKSENITNNPAQDIIPMWHGNKIYFVSDRTETMNIFVYDIDTKETKQLTSYKDYDVKFPSIGDDAIVYENGGYIYKLDLATGKSQKVSITINEDFDSGRGGLKDVSKNVDSYEIAPDGNRALFSARGDIFTVPAENGPTRNLTNTPGVHDRNPKWSPDGKWIAFISDKSGEDEIYVTAQDGSGETTRLTTNADTYKYSLYWSPDSKKIMWADKKLRLLYVDVTSKKVTEVAQAKAWEYSNYVWSPDSKWIAYSQNEVETLNKVYLYSLETSKSTAVTDGWYSSYSPEFSSDGNYLFFVSDRSFNPSYGWTEFQTIYRDMSKIYFVTLAKETPSPFEPTSDEVKVKEDKKESSKSDSKDDKSNDVKIDLDGITSRIIDLPISNSGYGNLSSVGDKLYYSKRGSSDKSTSLMVFDYKKKKETDLGSIGGYEISADGKKILIGERGSYAILDLPLQKVEMKDKLDLSDMKVKLDRHAEWAEIFNECWRQMRDFYFDPNMHGVNWKSVKEKYAPLVPYVNRREDLTYIIGEMIGEINSGHLYVGGGDYPKPERINLGLLGARLERDSKTGFYKIVEILKGENWDNGSRSPLTEVGVNVNVGDYILAVDGQSTDKMNDIYESLIDKADKQVKLTTNSSPSMSGSRITTVVPIADEHNLDYYNWVEGNIEKVNKATNGEVGYIHIPDMGVAGLNEFVKHYYPQLLKKGLIIDVRSNGGGNVSPMIIEKLRRQAVMIDIARNSAPGYDPGGMQVGPKVALADEFSASDGDIFTYRFKHDKIGPVIGKRTWGGVVGIRGSLPLMDGGYLMKPEFSRYDLEGKKWIMEGHGVEPDIVVYNDPAKVFEGKDDQLDKAIEVIKEKLKNETPKIPSPPPYPDFGKKDGK